MSLLPALDDSEKSSSHGWSSASMFSQADMDSSQSNLYHQLITQNNSGDVPDALVEEEICYQEEAGQNSQAYQQSPVAQAPSQLKQQLLQQQQQQLGRQQQVRNYIQPPSSAKPQQKPVYPVVHSTGSPQHTTQTGNQQQVFITTVNQQARTQQTFSQAGSQLQAQDAGAGQQKFVVQSLSTQQQQQQQQQKQQQQQQGALKPRQQGQAAGSAPQMTDDELNHAIQLQQQKIDENNRRLNQLGLPALNVNRLDIQKSIAKCDLIGTVKIPNANSQNNKAAETANNVRQLLLIQNAQPHNNRKVNVNVVNSNGANMTNAVQTIPQSPSITNMAGTPGTTGQVSPVVVSGQRTTNNQVIPRGSNQVVLNQVHCVSSGPSQQMMPGGQTAGAVSKDKVVLEGGGQFEEGQAYLIHSKDGRTRTMLLKDGKFIPYNPDNNMIQHSQIDSSQRGRGRGVRGKQRQNRGRGRGQLHGNAIGVNMMQSIRGPQVSPGPRGPAILRSPGIRPGTGQVRQDFMHLQREMGGVRAQTPAQATIVRHPMPNHSGGAAALVPGRQVQRPPVHLQNLMPPAQGTKPATGATMQQLHRRPLHPEGMPEDGKMNEPGTDAVVAQEFADQTVAGEMGDCADPPKIPNDPNVVAICQFCGYTSVDKVKCESCSRKFTSATKFITKDDPDAKRRKLEVIKDGVGKVIDKKLFYSQKLEEQNQVYTKVFTAANSPTVLRTTRIISRGGQNRRGRGRGRGRVVMPAETVTISSDEEEGASCDKTTVPALTQLSQGNQVSSQASPLPTGSGSKSPGSATSECPESPLIPTIPISTQKVAAGRVEKMEDEKGASRSSRERSLTPVQVLLGARVVRVGTFRGSPIEPIVINKNGFSFCMEGTQAGTHRFNIFPSEIQQCLVNFDRSRLLFFLTSPSCGVRTRHDLGIAPHMNPKIPPPEPYFDPTGLDMTHQMITVVMDNVERETQLEFQKLMDTFKSWGKQGDEAFYMELSAEEANEILKQSTRKVPIQHISVAPAPVVGDHQYSSQQQAEEDRQSRSPSPPRMGFVGPIIKLLTYPPPPTKGALSITNEDLYCLQEGEFLNDVIIDFYLKYLFLEKLSKEDQARTHIFSSFFYKRLTQRIRGAAIDDDPNVTLAVKRHARVKTWTRHVDLFKKDFIIIPINEHSHWFLAIICYPGLTEPMENKYIPKPITLALPEPSNVPTPPQPTEEPGPEEMEMEESEVMPTPVPETSQDGTTPAAADTPSEAANTENDTDKPEMMNTDESNTEESEEKKPVQDTETDTGGEKDVNGSDEIKNESQTEASGSDSVEEKPEATTTEQEPKASTKPATGRSTTPNSTSSSTSTTATNAGLQMQRPVLLKMGSRGQKVTPGEEDKFDNVANGIKQPCVIVFDSLSGPPRSRIVQVLKEYLQAEWSAKKGGTELDKSLIKGCVPKVPQQNNYSDCGVYVLQYVESFFEDPVQDFCIPIKGLHDWFNIPKIEGKREELRDLIIELKEKYESQSEVKENTS